jgi:outer membrane protein assembly factor BamB
MFLMHCCRRSITGRVALVAAAIVTAAFCTEPQAADWPDWRGPLQDRHAFTGGPLVTRFDADSGENVLWRNEEAGGISTPIIYDGRLYTLVRHRPGTSEEAEKVLCLDARTGEKLWENIFNVYLSDVPAERVGWSCVIADPTTKQVFAHGVCGVFTAIDAVTGVTNWQRSLHEEFGFLSTYGGRTNRPIVFEDLVIASAVVTGWGQTAKPAHRFLGMDTVTGEVRWMNGTRELPSDTTYSTPMLAVIDGAAAMVFGSSDGGIWNLQPRTGRPIWNYQLSRRGLNVAPLVTADGIFMSQAEENLDNTSMGAAVKIALRGGGDVTSTNRIWERKAIVDGKAMPVVIGDRVYFAEDGAKVHAFDRATGQPIGKPTRLLGTIVRASPLVANGLLYVCSTSGWHVLEPTDRGLKFVDRMRLQEDDEVTASPIAWEGRLYLTSGERLYCLGNVETIAAATAATAVKPLPQQVAETTATAAGEPAWVQVVPAETQIAAGESVDFRVRLFDAQGRFIKESPASFTSDTGSVTGAGHYTAPAGQHAGATITAAVGELTGIARVRSMPPLPWQFDFDDISLKPDPRGGLPRGEPPLPWIGMRYRNVVREVDGSKCMVKITTIPKGTRSQGWIGPTALHDYRMSADLRAEETGASQAVATGDTDADAFATATAGTGNLVTARLPDMGLIAQRYTLDLMGASQQLQLRSWPPQVATHFSKTVPFPWKAGVWYRMKFEAETRAGDAVLRGKVWPRDQPEPDTWTVEAVHEQGNLQGSPGFFGNSKVSEIYVDNVLVENLQ